MKGQFTELIAIFFQADSIPYLFFKDFRWLNQKISRKYYFDLSKGNQPQVN
jgi:hypothetical protein